MWKKINNRLLTHWPLLWNTALVWVLLSLLVLHALFYLMGYTAFKSIGDLHNYSRYGALRDLTNLSILVIFLFFVLWLVFYLRHNAFKAFYPVTRFYLFKEFLIVFICCLMAVTFMITANAGYRQSVLNHTKNFNLEHDREIMNMAGHFIPDDLELFEIDNSCDSQAVRLQRAIEAESYDTNEAEPCDLAPAEEVPENYISDTVKPVELPVRLKDYNYLYYCSSDGEDIEQKKIYNEKAERWLRGGYKDSIQKSIQDMLDLSVRYVVYQKLNVAYWTNMCFADSTFRVIMDLATYNKRYKNAGEQYMTNEISSALYEIENFRRESITSVKDVVGYFDIAMVLALAIFSFRITRTRTWIMSVIGGVFWMIIIILSATNDSNNLANVVFIFAGIFLLLALLFILRKQFKDLAGMALFWCMGCMLAIAPLIFERIYQNTQEVIACIDHKLTVVYAAPPIHYWIGEHPITIAYGNLAFGFLLMFFLIIPLALKWQSNPEE